MSFMPSCRDIDEHSSEYLDRTLPFWQRLGVRLHLFMCVNCRRYLQHLQLTIATLARFHETEHASTMDPASVENIVKQLQREGNKPPHGH